VPTYGLAVVGLADPRSLLTIDRATPGDVVPGENGHIQITWGG